MAPWWGKVALLLAPNSCPLLAPSSLHSRSTSTLIRDCEGGQDMNLAGRGIYHGSSKSTLLSSKG